MDLWTKMILENEKYFLLIVSPIYLTSFNIRFNISQTVVALSLVSNIRETDNIFYNGFVIICK